MRNFKFTLFCILFIVLTVTLNAQLIKPKVPEKIEFAGLKLSLDKDAQEEVQKSVDKIMANESYFLRMVEIANIYFPIIEEQFKKSNFPEDVKYLCIQESAFKADAVSSSNAVGYWQFKEATALEQGLIVNSILDERKNLVSSSLGAAKYISGHNFRLRNWVFSVIAYNTGLGGVQSFYDPKYADVEKMDITKETHWYFLKFLAYKIAYQDFVGKQTSALKLNVYHETSGKTLEQIAGISGVSIADLRQYNLWISEKSIIPSEKPISVLIPYASNSSIAQVETKREEAKPKATETITEKKHEGHKKHNDKAVEVAITKESAPETNYRYQINGVPAITAVKGDNIDRLALKAGIDKLKFLKYNEINSFEDLVVGQSYFLKKKKSKSYQGNYTAQYGESLWDIAQKFAMNTKSIRHKNRMSKYETVQPGRVIWLSEMRPEEVAVEIKEVPKKKIVKENPKVDEKSTVISSDRQNETVKKSIEKEEIVKKDTIQPKFVHWVQPQEDLSMISRLYQVQDQEIIKWNGLKSDSLNTGMRLEIYESELMVKVISDTTLGKPSEKIQVIETSKNATEGKIISSRIDPVLSERRTTKFKTIYIEPGTTLYGLSKMYHISIDELKRYNTIVDNSLNAGDKIQIPIYEDETTDIIEYKTYKVQHGDTYYSISRKLGVEVEKLKLLNNKTDNSLKIGEELRY